ncbi:MAG: DcrB-related protein [Deltaproteobacteria bacterium]|nr:MAG: DcrB-related protein [Deltaproteobacteria bacterium]
MGKIIVNDIEFEIPANWQDQGMMTFTIPSPDKNVKPNIIMTKERLPQPIPLRQYFDRIKQSITNRGIRDFQVNDERDVVVAGVPGIQMVCTWDVSAMKQMLAAQQPQGAPPPDIKPGQIVKQVQLTLMKDLLALNLTGSFPADQFDLYFRPFQNFLKTLKFN